MSVILRSLGRESVRTRSSDRSRVSIVFPPSLLFLPGGLLASATPDRVRVHFEKRSRPPESARSEMNSEEVAGLAARSLTPPFTRRYGCCTDEYEDDRRTIEVNW